MGPDYAGRRERTTQLLGKLEGDPPDALLVVQRDHVRYLSGFGGSNAALLIRSGGAILATDTRYTAQVGRECPGLPTCIVPSGSALLPELLRTATREHGWHIPRLGFESAYLTVDAYDLLQSCESGTVHWIGVTGVIEQVKSIKEPCEIAAMRSACALADAACHQLLEFIRPGRTEHDVAWDLEAWLRTHGARRLGFETIVASGPRSAFVHGRASDRIIASSGNSEFVLVDFGCEIDGYQSDITRTFVVGGSGDTRMREMYAAVAGAQAAAKSALGPGVPGKEVDAIARRILSERGMPEMPHNTGHGLGMLVHDQAGTLSPRSNVVLAPGMVVTVEPGAYVESVGGVRIEDDMLIDAVSAESLTHFSRELIQVG